MSVRDQQKPEDFEKAVINLEIRDEFARSIALGRMGKHSEIAKAVLFLASDQVISITGAQLLIYD